MLAHLKAVVHKSILLSMVFSLLGVTLALAASGDLDPTFSGDGWVRIGFAGRSDGASDIVIQPDGKIVAAGFSFKVTNVAANNFALMRYNPNGSLDTRFNGDGKLQTDFGGHDGALSVALQPDGKILAAGYTCDTSGVCNVALARYKRNGLLDTTFSGDGKVVTDFGGADNSAAGLAILPNGKIIVTGNFSKSGFAVYRYLPNGKLDTTFSGDGRVRIRLGTPTYVSALAIQPGDGKIVMAGTTAGSGFDFVVIRLNPNGSRDQTFSGDGIQRTDFKLNLVSGADFAHGVAIQPNGKIVVVGQTIANEFSGFSVARYNPNGKLDRTFGVLDPLTGKRSGSLTFDLGAQGWGASDVAIQPDGKIVVLGTVEGEGGADMALVRLKPNGAFDTTFHGHGYVEIDFGGHDGAGALVRDLTNGKYVIDGSIWNGTHYDFVLARLLP